MFEPKPFIVLFVSVVVPSVVTTADVSKAIVKSLPEIDVTAVPPKILNTSPFAEIMPSVELSSCSFHVPSTVVPSPIAV